MNIGFKLAISFAFISAWFIGSVFIGAHMGEFHKKESTIKIVSRIGFYSGVLSLIFALAGVWMS